VKAFPTLNVTAPANPGDTVSLTFEGSDADNLFAVFFTGLKNETVPISKGKVAIPDDLRGQVYVLVSKDKKSATDDNIVAGPAILTFEFSQMGDLIKN
jgi:hypothetical protein